MLFKGRKRLSLPGFWKQILRTTIYFVVSLLLIQDCFIIIAHTISPGFLPEAKPFLLDKVLSAFVSAFSF